MSLALYPSSQRFLPFIMVRLHALYCTSLRCHPALYRLLIGSSNCRREVNDIEHLDFWVRLSKVRVGLVTCVVPRYRFARHGERGYHTGGRNETLIKHYH